MIIQGCVVDTTDLGDIAKEMQKIADKIKRRTSKLYNRLLGDEAALLGDMIALNILPRPQVPIIEDAESSLKQKIRTAMVTNVPDLYNMQVYVHFLPYDNKTYIKILCENEELLKAFSGLEDYSLNEVEYEDKKNKKTETWLKLHEKYMHQEPASLNLTADCCRDRDLIKYPDLASRVETIARHAVLNSLLSQISGGSQIPPHLLMPYLDRAMIILMGTHGEKLIRNKKLDLMNILIDFSKDDSILFEDLRSQNIVQEMSDSGLN